MPNSFISSLEFSALIPVGFVILIYLSSFICQFISNWEEEKNKKN